MQATISEREYVGFLVRIASTASAHDWPVMVLTHDAADRWIADRLGAEVGERISLLTMKDAVRTKALIGGAALVISSRYHGLVNALSQCVPAIATSWSHKYPLLLADYACSDGLWEVNDTSIVDRLDNWLDESFLAARREALRVPAAAHKESARAMWEAVHSAVARPPEADLGS